MSCHEIRSRLEAWVDGRVEAEEQPAIRDHLASCASCTAEIKLICEVEGRVREAFASDAPSAALRQRVDAVLMRDRTLAVARKGFGSAWRGALAASVVLVVVLGAAVAGLGLYRTPASQASVMTTSIEEMRAFLDSHRPFDIVSQDPVELRRWFEDKVDFTPPPPPVLAGLDPAGGRLCFFLDRRIAAYMYLTDGRVISLYVLPGAGLRGLGGETARLAGRQIAVGELAGFHGVFWRSEELAFALIADLPRAHLLELARRLIEALE